VSTHQVCIAGGGPAGMMLGLLLARAGVRVVVLEKHADFLRDFRGDTIHPSTLEVMGELGLLESLLKLPHQRIERLYGQIGDTTVPIADFRRLPTRCRFIALMPQWDFLDFLAHEATRYPGFSLMMRAEVTELVADRGRIVGVRATTAEGVREIRADLVVGADGRHSSVRTQAQLPVEEFGAPIDVLWFRLSRTSEGPVTTFGRIDRGRILVLLNRGDYWQCGYVIAKGTIDTLRARGIGAFRETIARLAPHLTNSVHELRDWQDVSLLTVRVDRLTRWWRPGLVCIGDAAHAMSPIGGVGINLAIQDAVAAANILATPLREGRASTEHLRAIQRRRMWPTRVTQRIQVILQNRVIGRVLQAGDVPSAPPWIIRVLGRHETLQRLPARLFGVGIRAEHVRTESVHEPSSPRAAQK
jgi:2-polyprenyl-6-methoxyphenol hydroxylase-like FAD-dependent oxidoreductase